ncbi:MAG: hydrogenase large subunit [Acidimicrobiales bacterium]
MTTHETTIEVHPDLFANEVAALTLPENRRLAGLFVVPGEPGLRLLAVIAGTEAISVVTTTLPAGVNSYRSVTALVPGADWYEREIHDLYGLVAIGHPDLDPLVLPLGGDADPPRPGLRRATPRLTPSDEPLAALVSGEGIFTISYGPVRSGVFEAIEYVVETPGEDIPRVQTRIHYKHRGVDAAFIGRGVEDGVLLAERTEGVASVAHATAFCQALERLSLRDIPPPAELVRALHAELERMANHLDSTIRHTEAAGQAVAFARLTLHKERLMQFRAALCGSRFGRGVVVPGGVSGPPLIDMSDVISWLDALEHDLRADMRLLMRTPSFLDRLRGTGLLPLPLLRARGALGPLARGSGSPEDVRSSRPYDAYRHVDFVSASHDGCDALARQLVRNDEMWTSVNIIRQVVDELDAIGHLSAASWTAPLEQETGEGFGWAEAPQGEVLYFVAVEGGVLTKVKPRSASFHNLALFTAAFPKDITTDFAFIEASFGFSVAGVAG